MVLKQQETVTASGFVTNYRLWSIVSLMGHRKGLGFTFENSGDLMCIHKAHWRAGWLYSKLTKDRKEDPGMVLHAYNPSTQEVEGGGLLSV